MNRQTRMLVVVVVAVVTAALASFAVLQAVRRMPVRQVEVPAGYAVVAARPLEMGARLTKADIKLIGWPARNPVNGSFSKIDAVVDRGLIAVVAENEPITETKLAPLGAGSGLPPAIKPGMRAMSVKVNEVVGVAGFVMPGTRVDVIVTIRQDRDSVSRVVASNLQVLTAGSRYDEGEAKKEGKAIPSTVVTLMVTPADAERIALASHEGQIMLALRNPIDTGSPETAGVRTATLLGAEVPSPLRLPPATIRPKVLTASVVPARAPVAARAVDPVPLPRTIETIRAGKRQVEVVQ